jgi:hypothetical protein
VMSAALVVLALLLVCGWPAAAPAPTIQPGAEPVELVGEALLDPIPATVVEDDPATPPPSAGLSTHPREPPMVPAASQALAPLRLTSPWYVPRVNGAMLDRRGAWAGSAIASPSE